MILLDTHVVIWLLQADPTLGRQALALIETELASGEVLVPAICVWEVAMLVRNGRLVLPLDVPRWFERAFSETGLRLAPLEPAIASDTALMDWAHRDPADRMIVATARYWNAPLLSVDRMIKAYAQAGHIEAIDASR